MGRYKILSLDFPFNNPNKEENWETAIECGLMEISPKFYRDGRYYDRVEKIAWYEIGDRAFQEWRTNDFILKFNKLQHRALTENERNAIKILINYGSCPKSLREKLRMDNFIRELKSVRRNSRMSVQRILNGK